MIVTPNSFSSSTLSQSGFAQQGTPIYLGKPLSRASSVLVKFGSGNSSQTLLFTLHGNASGVTTYRQHQGGLRHCLSSWVGGRSHTTHCSQLCLLSHLLEPILPYLQDLSIQLDVITRLRTTKRNTAKGTNNTESQLNIVLVCEVQEGPENSRESICRGRFIFTPTYFETGKGARVGMNCELWIPIQAEKATRRKSVSLEVFPKGSEGNFWRSGRGPSNRVRL